MHTQHIPNFRISRYINVHCLTFILEVKLITDGLQASQMLANMCKQQIALRNLNCLPNYFAFESAGNRRRTSVHH